MRREFTGRDMAKILVAGFGVVVAVNFGMATIAARSFSGTSWKGPWGVFVAT